ncbi:HEAT repeat domain-containing protein [Actinoplanes bogorensis]|uniref:HEAT repeat domain-containing protein n=1 Tax=Paractinoplanes bogorensis TaxID=1610840 RepID=A0ABS5Z193_9ACTN|nr:HEAT repeat domain-containing protein [Actinoplanes bogorensis]MBU2668734.1 HEAT repeat domain-containing protein [Actinoplanes bogorensis]
MRELMFRLSTDGQAARAELVALGADAVGPLIAELFDEGSPVGWSDIGMVLRSIGRPAFAPLAEGIAAAPTREVERRCGWAFMGFGVDLLDDYVGALGHPSPRVRENAALGIQYCGEFGAPAVPGLVALLDDEDDEVRRRVIWALGEIGESAVASDLRWVRRHGPGRRRAAALQALAEVGGIEAFSEADRAAVERLIRVKLVDERIEGDEPCGRWLALPTGDQAAVLEALDLSEPRPATMRLGRAAVESASHGPGPDERRRAIVFVSPQLDDWTLVFGYWAPDRELDAIRELSTRFGQAQAYWYDDQTGSSGWTIAESGQVIRHYSDAGEEPIGERLPIELTKPTFADMEELPPEEWPTDDDYCDALAVAATMSISPAELGPDTRVRGNGVLALTRAGREYGKFPAGALPI